MQLAKKVASDRTATGLAGCRKFGKQADLQHSPPCKKESLRTVPGGWVGMPNLHDAIVVAFQHEMQNNRNAV